MPPKSNTRNPAISPNADGIKPSNKLPPKSNTSKPTNASNPVRGSPDAGSRPVLSPAGMEPDNRLSPRFNNVKSLKPPNETGMDPRSRLPDKSK